tara:strand:+ start:114 stop:1055 length:942 start_codon:yes stop_codon:yes gene_type:complete
MDLSLSIITIVLSTITIILSQRYFLHKKIVDNINHRSSHSSIATRSGGIAIFVSVFITSCFFYISGIEIYDFSLIIPLSLLALIGLYDDVYRLDFKLKFIFQIIAAKLLIDNGLIIDNLHGLFGIFELNRLIAQLLTIFISLAIINSINFVDGVDGLAITVVLLFILMFELFVIQSTPYINFSIVIICSIIPLYFYNFKKTNKVFLGDSGSLFLGGVVSIYTIFIFSQEYIIKERFDVNKIIFIISILTYPIIDMIRVVLIRIVNKKSPFQADKKHIHHFIISKTNNHFLTTLIILMSTLIVTLTIQLLNYIS